MAKREGRVLVLKFGGGGGGGGGGNANMSCLSTVNFRGYTGIFQKTLTF